MTEEHQRLEEMIRVACLWEATARKPGNVHPAAAFEDLTYDDFVRAAEVSAPILSRATDVGVGRTVLSAIRATREATGRNVNLGIVLLLAPLAAVPANRSLADGIGDVLNAMDLRDAELVYEAIRLAVPGGMGTVEDQDVATVPTESLMWAMKQAADRDQIAAEYASGFAVVCGHAAAQFADPLVGQQSWNEAIVHQQLKLMATSGDSLIGRKCGEAVSAQARRKAGRALDVYEETGCLFSPELDELDRWLRGDGHRRNPGTTADLVAAILFAAFRDGSADVEEARRALSEAGVIAFPNRADLINERRQ